MPDTLAYRRFLERQCLTQEQAADILAGATKRSGARWVVNGPPFTVELILRLIQHFGLPFDIVKTLSRDLKKRRQE